MKAAGVYILVFAGIILAFFLFSDDLAHIAWEKFKQPDLAIRLVRSDAKLAFDIGNYYFGLGDYDLDLSEVAFKRALEIDQKYPLANYQLSRILFVKGQSEPALEAINRELEYYPENQRSHYVRGLIYGFSDKLPEAEDDFRKFTEWAPSEWAGYNDLSWILAKEGKYAESVKNLERAFEKVSGGGENAWLQNSLGVAHLNLENYQEAKEAFSRAKELAETMPLREWHLAYPGNSADSAKRGFESFKAAIDANLSKVRYLDNSL